MLEPLLGRVLEIRRDDGGLREPERAGGAAQAVRIAAQLFDRRGVIARGDQPFGQLGDRAELVAGPLQVLVPDSGRQAEVVDATDPTLVHAVQDM